MKRTTIFLDEQVEREVQALARRQRRPMASVVREAVEQYVVAQRAAGGRGLPGYVALGRSGHADTAERHEALIFGDLLDARSQAPGRASAREKGAPTGAPAPSSPRRRTRRAGRRR